MKRWNQMTKEQTVSDPEFKSLFSRLEKCGLADVVWAVFNGNLFTLHKLAGTSDDDSLAVAVSEFVKETLETSVSNLRTLRGAHPHLKPIVNEFKENKKYRVLAQDVMLPTVNKVFRIDIAQEYYIPASPAIALILYHQLAKVPSIDELKKLCAGAFSTPATPTASSSPATPTASATPKSE